MLKSMLELKECVQAVAWRDLTAVTIDHCASFRLVAFHGTTLQCVSIAAAIAYRATISNTKQYDTALPVQHQVGRKFPLASDLVIAKTAL
jgi:hypothetical protein